MLDPKHPLAELLESDDRYRFDAYVFVFEALHYAQEVLGLGTESTTDSADDEADDGTALSAGGDPTDEAAAGESAPDESQEPGAEADPSDEDAPDRHLTGQELCEAIRVYALEQYGYMAKSVLNHWGVRSTKDFGEIVFNLIEIGQMRKTPDDRREDFEKVFDFEEGFHQDFEITLPD